MRGWFSIPAHRPFLEDLAAGLVAEYGSEPESLAQTVILLPSRRGARDLAEAFLQAASGRTAILLPRILALGDLETGEPPFEPAEAALDLRPAIDPLRRRFELARLAADHAETEDEPRSARWALETADALAAFLDTLQVQERERAGLLDGLVLDEYARHFQRSASLLDAVLSLWPDRREALGVMDPAERRAAVLNRLSDEWEAAPPAFPVIAAGMNETAPAAVRLFRAVAEAPRGCVVLPGLDEALADDAWAEVGEAHPQGAHKALLAEAGLIRTQVSAWPASRASSPRGEARRRVINEALRPAEATADWLGVIDRLREGRTEDPIRAGLDGLTVVAAAHEEEAAALCALLMREALETPDRTCALVTPDPALARRVEARLSRWGLTVDDSAGRPLSRTLEGGLLALVARLMVDPLDPVTLLAVLKSPLVRADPRARAGLENGALRGPRPRDWREVRERLRRAGLPDHRGIEPSTWRRARLNAAREMAERLETILDPLPAEGAAVAFAEALVERVEALAGDRAWRGPEGEAAARLMAGLFEHGAALPPLTIDGFADLVQALLDDQTLRIERRAHPRLRILGAIEARLVRADRMILAGLEEGVWPRAAATDPFLSRPMKRALGLPSPETRLGLAAHDFAQAASAPEVWLVHAERRDGQPAVPSRWLWRLRTLAKGAQVELPTRPELHAWVRALDAPDGFDPARRPEPRPPVDARPTRWSVTDAERLTRDPYAVWARKVMRLESLAPPDEAVDARLRGTAIHKAFEDFAAAVGEGSAPDPALFQERYMAELAEGGMDGSGLARELALSRPTAEAAAAFETRRRADGRRVLVEQRGETAFQAEGRTHALSARADRIEVLDGRAHILDIKTGATPGKGEVEAGFAPQLTLTGALAQRGAFLATELEPEGLVYVRVTGRAPPIEERDALSNKVEVAEACREAFDGFVQLVGRFENAAEPYRSRVAPKFLKRQGDYDHLARVQEWSTSGSEEGGE